MEKEIEIKIETVLNSFSTGMLQDAVNLATLLEANGLCFSDIEDYLSERRKEILLSETAFVQDCSMCDGQMTLSEVNTGKGDQTGDRSKSVWTCGKCLHQEFNIYTAKERLLAVKGEN